jgi:hypothetical protein
MPNKELDEAKLRDAAYQLWLAEGQPEGRDQEHWHRAAEALATSEANVEPKAPRKAAPKAAAKPKAPAKPKAAAKPKAPPKPRKPKAT